MKFELLIKQIEQTHQHFQSQASKTVNISLTLRNWLIGFYLVEFEQNREERAAYGKKLLQKVAEQCADIKGIDERSLRSFRSVYLQYPQISTILPDEVGGNSIRRTLSPNLK